MCDFDVMGNLHLINRNLAPNLCIEERKFVDTSEGIKIDHGINLLLFKLNNILKLYPFKRCRRCKMFTLKNSPTDPLFLNESGSALSRAVL